MEAVHAMKPSQYHGESGLALLEGRAPSHPSIQNHLMTPTTPSELSIQIIPLLCSLTASPHGVHLTTLPSLCSLPFTHASPSASITTDYLRTSSHPAPPSILHLHSTNITSAYHILLFPLYSIISVPYNNSYCSIVAVTRPLPHACCVNRAAPHLTYLAALRVDSRNQIQIVSKSLDFWGLLRLLRIPWIGYFLVCARTTAQSSRLGDIVDDVPDCDG
jgi:hypothetical protein